MIELYLVGYFMALGIIVDDNSRQSDKLNWWIFIGMASGSWFIVGLWISMIYYAIERNK